MRKPLQRIFSALCRAPNVLPSAAFLFTLAMPGAASAYTEKVLHSFCPGCAGGESLLSGLLLDQNGDLYGTAALGGNADWGTLYELVPNADKTKYTTHILKTFCKDHSCKGGGGPVGDLIADMDGNLYGTTTERGVHGQGTIFKLAHHAGLVTFTVLRSSCAKTNCTDGSDAETGLTYSGQISGAPWDGSSPLFGTTRKGGAHDSGVVYELTPNGSSWTYQVIHTFGAGLYTATAGPLIVSPAGSLLGMTGAGGKYGGGALYRLAAGTWKEATLHNFCAQANCADGSEGVGRLTIDAAGNLFGATVGGGSGAGCSEQFGCGVAFERTAGGTYSVLYNFCSLSQCTDGNGPLAGMILDASGNLYGTTLYGGNSANSESGTTFKLAPGSPWTETLLYAFCGQQNCTDGVAPRTPLTMDPAGNLFGTTTKGGANQNGGVAFELVP